MTRHAREAISLAAATALGETVMLALMTTEWSQVGAVALLFAFLIGPPLFLALLAWRRRTHQLAGHHRAAHPCGSVALSR